MTVNDILWGLSNLIVAYVAVAILLFTLFYGLFFKWWQRSAGISVFMDRVALVGVIALVFIGVFVDPQRGWWEAPPDVLGWRPWFRVIVYGAVAFAVTFQFTVAIKRYIKTKPIEIDVDPRTRPRPRR